VTTFFFRFASRASSARVFLFVGFSDNAVLLFFLSAPLSPRGKALFLHLCPSSRPLFTKEKTQTSRQRCVLVASDCALPFIHLARAEGRNRSMSSVVPRLCRLPLPWELLLLWRRSYLATNLKSYRKSPCSSRGGYLRLLLVRFSVSPSLSQSSGLRCSCAVNAIYL